MPDRPQQMATLCRLAIRTDRNTLRCISTHYYSYSDFGFGLIDNLGIVMAKDQNRWHILNGMSYMLYR